MVSNLVASRLLGQNMLNKKGAAERLKISRETLDRWLERPEMKRILGPKILRLPHQSHLIFEDSRINLIARHLPPPNPKGGKRLSRAIIRMIEEELS